MAKEAKKKEKKMNDNTSKKDSKREKKHFFKSVKAELKKVIWPTPKQLFNNTLAVIVSVIVVGVIVFLLDFCFEKINTFGVEKLKTIVQSSENVETENTLLNSTTDENSESNSENSDEVVENTTTDDATEGPSEE